jgi:hypothetical protein
MLLLSIDVGLLIVEYYSIRSRHPPPEPAAGADREGDRPLRQRWHHRRGEPRHRPLSSALRHEHLRRAVGAGYLQTVYRGIVPSLYCRADAHYLVPAIFLASMHLLLGQ